MKVLIGNFAGGARAAAQEALPRALAALVQGEGAAVVLIQEAAREIPSGADVRGSLQQVRCACDRDQLGIIADAIAPEYTVHFLPAIQSHRDSHPAKWDRMGVPSGFIRAQGSAIAVHERVKLCDFWTGEPNGAAEPIPLRLSTEGSYRGVRDSEPRFAMLLRVDVGGEQFVLANVHLATLTGERADDARIDAKAQALRHSQMQVLSQAHRTWKTDPHPKTNSDATWLIAGDFNAPRSEIERSPLHEDFESVVDARTRPEPRARQVDMALLERTGQHTTKYAVLVDRMPSDQQPGEVYVERPAVRSLVEAGGDHYPICVEIKKGE